MLALGGTGATSTAFCSGILCKISGDGVSGVYLCKRLEIIYFNGKAIYSSEAVRSELNFTL